MSDILLQFIYSSLIQFIPETTQTETNPFTLCCMTPASPLFAVAQSILSHLFVLSFLFLICLPATFCHPCAIISPGVSMSCRTTALEVNGLQEASLAKRLRGTPERIELENYRLSLQREEELEEVPEETLAEHNLSSVLDKPTDVDLGSRYYSSNCFVGRAP